MVLVVAVADDRRCGHGAFLAEIRPIIAGVASAAPEDRRRDERRHDHQVGDDGDDDQREDGLQGHKGILAVVLAHLAGASSRFRRRTVAPGRQA